MAYIKNRSEKCPLAFVEWCAIGISFAVASLLLVWTIWSV